MLYLVHWLKKKTAVISIVTSFICCKVRLTPMPGNWVLMPCTHSRTLHLFIQSLQTALIAHILRLAHPYAILASSVHAPVSFCESGWSLRHGLLAVFTLVCSSNLHGWSAREALPVLIHVARGSYIAIAYPPSCRWGLLAIVYRSPTLHAGAALAIAHPCCRRDHLPIWRMGLPLLKPTRVA